MFVVSTFSELQESRHVLASVGGPEEEKQKDGSERISKYLSIREFCLKPAIALLMKFFCVCFNPFGESQSCNVLIPSVTLE